MQTANITLLLGGREGQTIQKWGVTASEIEVLRRKHGSDAVRDVEYIGDVSRSNRAELERLHALYGAMQPDGSSFSRDVAALFPGAAARLFDKLSEIELDETFVKSLGPAEPKAAVPEPKAAPDVPLAKLTKAQLVFRAQQLGLDVSENESKSDLVKAIENAPAPTTEGGEDDGEIEDMPDGNLFQ